MMSSSTEMVALAVIAASVLSGAWLLQRAAIWIGRLCALIRAGLAAVRKRLVALLPRPSRPRWPTRRAETEARPVAVVRPLAPGEQWQRLASELVGRIEAAQRAGGLHRRAGIEIDAAELSLMALIADIGPLVGRRLVATAPVAPAAPARSAAASGLAAAA